MSRPPFPFVVGVGRSGTTMLRAMLDSHPDLCVPGESHFLGSLLRPWRRRTLTEGGVVVPDRLLSALSRSRQFRNWDLDAEALAASLAAPPAPDLAEAIRRIYRMHADAAGKPRYGDKTPSYVDAIGPIGRLLPEARFVHLIRDGRDVALSQLAVGEWGPTSVDAAAAGWRRQVRNGRRAGGRLGPSRYMELRYEDLVASPEDALRRVCRFVDLPWSDAMLRYDERADTLLADVALPGNQQGIRQAPTKGLRRWQDQMAPADVHRFEAIAGPELARRGYELRGGTGPTDRVRGEVARAAVAARRGAGVATAVARRVVR